MADANIENVVEQTQGTEVQEVKQEDAKTEVSVSDTEKRLADLETELTKTREILEKARKGEKYAKQTKSELEQQLAEQGKYKELYEQANNQLRNLAMDQVLTEAARNAKAKNIQAVMRLVDRSKIEIKDGAVDSEAVTKAIAQIRTDVSELFEPVEVPTTARAAETQPVGGYDREIRTAKSIKEIQAVMMKYNKV